jgi:hypothetical protein
MTTTHKKKSGFSKTLLNLLVIIPTLYSIFGKIIKLIEFEARATGNNLIRILILSFTFVALMITTWICMLSMLFVYLETLFLHPLIPLSIILFLNIFLLLMIGFTLNSQRKNLFFPEMRNQMNHIYKIFTD